MILATLQYNQNQGWTNAFPDLDSPNTFILIFAASDYIKDPSPIHQLIKAYPQSTIIGCSSAGEILGATVSDHSISVSICKFAKTTLKLSIVNVNDPEKSYDAGVKLSASLVGENLRGIFILSEGLHINGSKLVQGLNTLNISNVIITGGLAGDGSRFKTTWVIANGELLTNKIIGIGFYGEHIRIGYGFKGGWDIFGSERRITRSKNNILYELDGKPALDLYKEYLGEKASGLPASGLLFPLAIRKNFEDEKKIVRTILGIDEKENALIFAGDMPMGSLAQLMRANFDRLVGGAKEAGEITAAGLNTTLVPLLVIAVSCVGRKLLLGERIEEETEAVLNMFPVGTQQVGFYSYGEISPYEMGSCELHNQTMTLTSIGESV